MQNENAQRFALVSKYKPAGSQPEAISKLVEGLNNGIASQVLLGVTGSGKTFTMANVIAAVNRPTLIIAHNKTLAAQLCNEFRGFFPHNRVEYFVSYYDYYQPEAYLPASDTYIEKDMAINDEIDKLRHSATSALAERRDTVVVASVSCIYGLGGPAEYYDLAISLRPNEKMNRKTLLDRLVEIQYTRAGDSIERATFRSQGDTVDILPSYSTSIAIRVQFFGDEIEAIYEIDALTGVKISSLNHIAIFPATHYAVGSAKLTDAIKQIRADMETEVTAFEVNNMMLEAHRLRQRTNYDMEMLGEIGFCKGIENYSRYFDGRTRGEPPYTLMSYFPKDYITFIDESHMTVPQIRSMFSGDKARKSNLVDYGFRLKSAYDNRPLNFDEFNARVGQVIFVSATPAEYEIERANGEIVEQIIRPTGLLDPEIEIREQKTQILDLTAEIKKTTKKGGRVLATTLTKKMAEDLTEYLTNEGIRVRYLHSDIDTLDRVQIITALRRGEFDVLIGINLLREGLDIPETMLVAILDADKEGLFRNRRSLIQTIGRASRNALGKVIMYANAITDSMRAAIDETNRRRKIQSDFNEKHGITPKTVFSEVSNSLYITEKPKDAKRLSKKEVSAEIEHLKALMEIASRSLDFETAIKYREEIARLKSRA
ncbi:MAG: excinuclease ABC subunit UvrB [Christensenellaceae bacterium]|jgi:excinuclease ABC subunit B|nr:excinuclease ABC subunit UvrB [Christensenellaceae bacterium]